MAKSIFMKWIMQAYMMPSLNIYLKPNDLMHSFGALRVVIHDPRHTECSNLTEAIWTQYICWYIYIYIYILHIYILFYITYIYRYTYTWELQARPHRRRGCHPHTFSEIVLFQWKSAFVSFSKAPNWPRHPQNPVGGLKLQIFLFNEKM